MFNVYILYSKSINKYYIGQTANLENRLIMHELKLSRFTKQADDWEVVYIEEFKTRSEAMIREKEIKKKKSRKYIEYLVNQGK